MLGVVAGWFFVGFLYFKVAFDAYYYTDITIIASLILAIILAVFIFYSAGIYAKKLFIYNVKVEPTDVSVGELLAKTFLPFAGIALCYSLISRLVIFGFSKRLDSQIDFFNYRGNLDEDGFVFLAIVIAPLTLHLGMCIHSTWFQNQKDK